MFNVLQIRSSTLSLLRCKGCKNIIFRQDSIRQFISYDPNYLEQISNPSGQLKLQVEANYFVLEPQTNYYSSIRIDYEIIFFTNCHPLFKMTMFKVYCAQCNVPLGFQICTVNQNTVWMERRLLIDVQKSSIFKDGKDQMPRLIKALKLRLISKLSTFKARVQNKPVFNKKKQAMQRLQKISAKSKKSHVQKSDHLKRDKSKLKKGFESIQTTNPSINFVSKADTLHIQNSNFISTLMKNDQVTHGGRSIESTTIFSMQAKNNSEERPKWNEKIRQIQFQKVKPKLSLVRLKITELERDQIKTNLHMIKENILQISYDLESRANIVRILNVLTKASVQEKYIYKKIPSQTQTLNNLMTLIRKNFIGDLPSRN